MNINLKDNIVVLLRGVPGSGKSTWLKEHQLEDYSIATDRLRLLLSNPVKTPQGYYEINQQVSDKAWQLAYELLESRMDHGGVTFFDATFMNDYLVNYVKGLTEKHNYKLLVVDFNSVGLAEAKRRNKLRQGTIRYVPEYVLDNLWKEGAQMQFNDIQKVDYSEVEIIPLF